MSSISLQMDRALKTWFATPRGPRFYDFHHLRSDPKVKELQKVVLECLKNSSSEEKEHALAVFRQAVVNTYTATKSRAFFNLRFPGMEPAPFHRYYKALSYPFLAGYHISDATASIFALDFAAVKEVIPPAIFSFLGGHIHPDEVDVFLSVDNQAPVKMEHVSQKYKSGDFFTLESAEAKTELLVKFHRWFFPLPTGQEEGEQDLYMGAFAGFGCSRAEYNPIAIDSMQCMKVHVHDGCYSPNNAHIAVDTDMPYSSIWIAARKDSRICIAKVIKNTHQPKMQGRDNLFQAVRSYFSLGENVDTLEEYTRRLRSLRSKVAEDVIQALAPILGAKDVKEIQADVSKLPQSMQKIIYKLAWEAMGSPLNIDKDFGRKAFFHDESLDSAYWLIDPQYRSVLSCAAEKIQIYMLKDLIDDPLMLLYGSTFLEEPPSLHKPIQSHDLQRKKELPQADISTTDPLLRCFNRVKQALMQGDQATPALQSLFDDLDRAAKEKGMQERAFYRLCGFVYHYHTLCKEENPSLSGTDDPDFAKKALLLQENVRTAPLVMSMALDALKETLPF